MMKPFDRKKAIGRVAAICRKAVAPFGYDDGGRSWKHVTDRFARVINLQTNRRDDLSHLSFTFNVGMFFPEVYSARHQELPQPPIQEWHCCPRERVGELFFGGDKWWGVDRNTNASNIERELTELLTGKVVPWLAQFDSLEDVFAYLRRRKNYFEAAVTAHAMGRDDVAAWIEKALRHAPHDLAARGIEIWARDNLVAMDGR